MPGSSVISNLPFSRCCRVVLEFKSNNLSRESQYCSRNLAMGGNLLRRLMWRWTTESKLCNQPHSQKIVKCSISSQLSYMSGLSYFTSRKNEGGHRWPRSENAYLNYYLECSLLKLLHVIELWPKS